MLSFYALFTQEHDGFISVRFPDLEMCMTQGRDFEEAYEMAVEALAISIGGNPQLKISPTKRENISVNEKEELVPIPVDAQLVVEYSPKRHVSCSFNDKIIAVIDQYTTSIGLDRSAFLESAAMEYIQNHPK